MRPDFQKLRPEIVVIDGNHNFEFAGFDIEAAARRVSRGEFIFINNAPEPWPYFAAMDFLRARPERRDGGMIPPKASDDDIRAIDRSRTGIDRGDLIVLRARLEHDVTGRPESRGEIPWTNRPVGGVRLSLDATPIRTPMRAPRTQRRAHGGGRARYQKMIDGKTGTIEVTFMPALLVDDGMDQCVVESWLAWQGETGARD
ncbi:MAG: hypothetical protein WAV02_11010 [Stellaceae bacterium]